MRARTYVRTNYIFFVRVTNAGPHRSMRMRKVSTFPRVRMPRCIKKLVRLMRKLPFAILLAGSVRMYPHIRAHKQGVCVNTDSRMLCDAAQPMDSLCV